MGRLYAERISGPHDRLEDFFMRGLINFFPQEIHIHIDDITSIPESTLCCKSMKPIGAGFRISPLKHNTKDVDQKTVFKSTAVLYYAKPSSEHEHCCLFHVALTITWEKVTSDVACSALLFCRHGYF